MFGTRLKMWMENYIGRPKKKEKDKCKQNDRKGVILESSESLAQSDTGISSSSQQVLTSSGTENKEGYCTTTMESERSGMTHCHTAVSLPSPESAYSTGYSTDGASPGGTGPPEYYINIRTGKHYFPSPAPTPTSPQPSTAFSQVHPINTFLNPEVVPRRPAPDPRLGTSPRLSGGCPTVLETKQNTLSASVPSHFENLNFTKSPCKILSPKSQLNSLKLFLKSPKTEKGKGKESVKPVIEIKKKVSSPTRTKRWFGKPFQKLGNKRPDPEDAPRNLKKEFAVDKNICYLLAKESTASPRQRNRIKTNPWLPTEPMSSQNFHSLQITFSPNLPRNRSCTNTPLQNRKTNEVDTLQNRIKHLNVKYEESRDYLNSLERAVSRHIGGKVLMELSDHSEEDLTLNEMMGTYNESYVYEKETDILSDSDPTDCEDYVTDSEADNGGDERDSHDDELDFIDNGSIVEGDDSFPGNTGKCTYHDVCIKRNSFLYKTHQYRKDSEKKSFRKDDSKVRRERRRHSRKSLRGDDDKRKQKVELNENVGGLNLNRVLLQRMMAKKSSKSAEGTPTSGRRQRVVRELKETHIGVDRKLKSDPFDVETDRKYNELIMEAENMFESMQNSPLVKNRKMKLLEGTEPFKENMESVDIWKKTETMCCPQFGLKERKSPKLALKLETPKKLELDKKSSFKARSSAHSPLDPLGPTFRNFSVFKPASVKVSTSSSDDSEPLPAPTKVPIAFQSIDLGKPLSTYCPQSEPVKRKIYSCSKTYDKLVKQFEQKPTIFEETSREAPRGPRRRTKEERREERREEKYPYSPRRASAPGNVSSPRLPQRQSLESAIFR